MWLPALFCILAVQLLDVQAQRTGLKPNWQDTSQIVGRTIDEDTPTGSIIATVKAVDPEGGPITYSLSGRAAEYLEINETSGEIKIKVQLDFERDPDVDITVIATDIDGDSRAFGSSLSINDANDLFPQFSETYYNFNLQENTTVGYTITPLSVTDRDTKNALLQVTCDDSTQTLARACEVFRLQRRETSNKYWRGYLILNSALNYEFEKSYSIRLLAFDGKNEKSQEVQIGVIDINDSPPYFVRARQNVIPEGSPPGTYIDYVLAKDTDEAESRPIRYELFGDTEGLEYFNIGKVSGNITNKLFLDYEDPRRVPGKEFTLQIRARELLGSNPEVLGNDPITTATAVVTIRLTDINDNCPEFDQREYTVRIREDIPEGSNIPLQMTVTDKDSGPRSTFDLRLIDPSATFEVTPTSGRSPASVTIRVVKAANIDYETVPRNYDLTVRAVENGNGIRPLNCPESSVVHIIVVDVNDVSPQFDRISYRTRVKEDAPGGTVLIIVTANDQDSGKFGKDGIRYSLIGSGADLFEINAISGVVTVKTCGTPGETPCIDYERKQRYDLAVQALDNEGGIGALPGTAQLIIDVEDVNDNQPSFISDYFRFILEGNVTTTDPLVIKAIDRDAGASITYSIPAGQTEARLWQVNPITGEVTAIRPIKYADVPDATRGSFRFEAQASDGKYDSLVRIEISVIDVNDNPPVFQPREYRVAIPESTPGDSQVIQVSVSDKDSPTTGNGQVDVSIDGGSFGKFTVRSGGTLDDVILANIVTSQDATFDYDVQRLYNLTVKARDRGNPSNTGTAIVIVEILDTNNKDPYFDPPTTSVSVYENKPVGYLVTTVTARDRDADSQLTITFASPTRAFNPSGIEVNDPTLFENLFAIDSEGRVTVNAPLDRNIVNFMTYRLYVQDTRVSPPQEGYGTLFIRILEYNDQAPVFDLPFYNLSVLEERPLASFVGSVLARDVDDQIQSYRLKSNPGDLFTISNNAGLLRVNGRIDYETQHNVTLIAQAFDSGSPQRQNTTVVFINIININDNTPIFGQTVYKIDLLEHSTRTDALIRIHATDGDEGDYGVVRYSVNDPYFRIDGVTGDIYLKNGANLDRETLTTYTFQVTAYDSPLDATVRLNTTAPVYIILGDINDNCPEFSQASFYSGVVIETADISDQVVELFATDKDSDENSRIVFTIDRASANPPIAYDLFDIKSVSAAASNMASGRIEVKNSLRKKAGLYNFTVTASDMEGKNDTGKMCSTSIPVVVRVQEAINDAPEWVRPPSSNFSIDVLESQYRGMLVYDCRAHDVNSGNAGIIDYSFNVNQSLVGATNEFRINPVTCIIRAQIVYDREQVDSYVLTLVAKDRGDPSASSETVLIVRILDVNDNEPEFPMRNGETIPIKKTIREGETPAQAGVIGRVEATDKDSDHKNNEIFYKIVAGNDEGYFVLDRKTGELRLNPVRAANGLDREAKSSYSMDILAYNEVYDDSVIRNRRKRSTNPSIVTFTVEISDENDTPPRFTNRDYYGCVPQNARFGQSILQVAAVDEDVGPVIKYSKVRETTSNFFSVDERLGIIRNAKLLYDIGSRQPLVTIQADDNGDAANTPGSTAETTVKIFVTDSSNEVVLEMSKPSADVRFYQDQLISVMRNSSTSRRPISYVCIREIRDHIGGDGVQSFTSSDVFLSAIGRDENGNNFIYSGTDLRSMLVAQLNDERTAFNYRTLYVKDVIVDEESDKLSLTEDPVLAIFIIALLLLFLALLLFCLACCLIRNSKKKKMKKLRAVGSTHVEVVRHEPPSEPVMNVNPVYDNKGYQGEDEYAVVQKKSTPAPQPVGPPIIPVVIPAEDGDEPKPDVYIAEPVPEVPPQEPEPEPVIITEPIMSEEPEQVIAPPPEDFFDPEPVIETEVMPDDEDQQTPVLSSFAGEPIDVEIRDDSPRESPRDSPRDSPRGSPRDSPRGSPRDSPRDSPRGSPPDSPQRSPTPPRSRSRSPSPPPPPPDEEFRIETNVM